jgi:F0F1-type ATP synthase assembly protein I
MAQEPKETPFGKGFGGGGGFGAGYSIIGAGFQFVFSILFFMGMGYLADRWLNTRPWLMLGGILLGLAAGFYAFWLRVSAMSKGGDGR